MIDHWWPTQLYELDDDRVCITVTDRRVVLGHLVARPRDLPESDVKYLEITALQVSEDFRLKGVGRALIERCRAWAHKAGYERLSVEASAKDPRAAEQFYLATGFTARSIILDTEV